MLRCLCSDLDEVSQAVLPFLNSYATKLRTTAKRNRVLDEVGLMFVLAAVLCVPPCLHSSRGCVMRWAPCLSGACCLPHSGQ